MSPPDDLRTDEQLIAALNAGDGSAFDGIYHRYRDRVARLALRFTGNHDDALDVLQETFTYLFRKFPGFALTSAMTTFLYPVVRNLSHAARRKRSRSTGGAGAETLDDLPGFVVADPNDARDEISAALARLPAAQRDTLLLRFVDELSLDEIAAATVVPLGTVKSRLHNALAALRADPKTKDYFWE